MSDSRNSPGAAGVRRRGLQPLPQVRGVVERQVSLTADVPESVGILIRELNQMLSELGRYIDRSGKIGIIDVFRRAILTGRDNDLVTGTAGTSGELLEWNADGDAVDSGVTADDVVEGPSSATDNSVPTYDGTTGKLLQDKGVLFIDDDGEVGIGIASPSEKLHLESSASNGARVRVNATGTGGNNHPGYGIYNEGGFEAGLLYLESSDVAQLWGGGAVAINIDGSQQVGIGTASPAETLTVGDDTNEAYITSTGDLYFAGTGGLVYGGISAKNNATATTISVAGTYYQVTIFDTNSPSNLCTPDHTNDHITITKAGDYLIICSATLESVAGGAQTFSLQVEKNNGATDVDPLHVHRDMSGGGGDVGSVSMSGIATLAANDTLEVWITNETAGNNVVIEDITLSVMQVGG